MLQPKRTKYRKRQKGRNDGLTKAGSEVGRVDLNYRPFDVHYI